MIMPSKNGNTRQAIIPEMGIFHAVTTGADRTHFRPKRLQHGVLRSNCIDCLDRTNVAQFAAARTALEHQLEALGLAEVNTLDYDSLLFQRFMDEYELMGNYIGMQYGGSQAHSGAFRKARSKHSNV